ncbi:MAG: hypothetical protein IPO31_00260 [Candidatus Obscuribacter sp.]|nr:hypothetical protein [Candidatus Obscuribacter sp.]
MRGVSRNIPIDLDELVATCYDERIRHIVREAVDCYKFGAYRACIVTTWIAVVYDFLYKISDLSEKGQVDARKLVLEFGDAQATSNYRKLLEFEQNILRLSMEQFEFITAMEYSELLRLFEDRHKCAHPSMNTVDEPYQATSEQARYHLRNAYSFFFRHAPTQGRGAIEKIERELLSNTFPFEKGEAKNRLLSGPLGLGVKESVCRSVILMVLTSVLHEELGGNVLKQRLSAIEALAELCPDIFESTLRQRLNDKVEKLDDTTRIKIMLLVRRCPAVWECLHENEKDKLKRSLSCLDASENPGPLIAALSNLELRKIGTQKLLPVDALVLNSYVIAIDRPELKDLVLQKFEVSEGFSVAASNMEYLILPIADRLTLEQYRRVLQSFVSNSQINGANYFMPKHMRSFLQANEKFRSLESNSWEMVYNKICEPSHLLEKEWRTLREMLEAEFGFQHLS